MYNDDEEVIKKQIRNGADVWIASQEEAEDWRARVEPLVKVLRRNIWGV